MKIAFISTVEGSTWGGSEELWSQTATRMASQGFTVAVSVKGWKTEAKQVSKIEQSNCKVVRRWYPQNRLQRLAYKLHKPGGFYTFLDDFIPELVIISQGNATENDGLGWMEACLVRNIPFAVISHGAAENFWPPDEFAMRLVKACTAARKCYFVSQGNLDLIIKQLAVQLKNAKVVTNPFNVSYTVDLPWPPQDKILKLACVARLDAAAKGQDILFEVFRSDKWRNRPIEVSLFGSGPNQKILSNLRQLWDLDNIKFCGFVTEVETIWQTHHALVLPSRYEGLPLALVEAMLCARPSIVTDVAGHSEIIEDNVNGFIATAPKAEYFDEALERAWQRKDDWYKIGQTAAIDVRRVIPSDPISVFVDEIKSLI